ncbi:MAG: hypothetical protein ACLPX9_22045 [Rhodomicrobium sp.]
MIKPIAWRQALLFIFVTFFIAAAARAEGVTPNDTARFLAGMPPQAGSPLEPLAQEKAFTAHAEIFDKAWAGLEAGQLAKVKAWSSENLKAPQTTLFYMFSGPDFLYANAFFPKAETYVMAGLELPGDMPDIAELPKSSIPRELSALRTSLNSVLSYSFFITREMRSRLYGRRELTGTLPVLFVFLARSGKTIKSVKFVELDKDGALHPAGTVPQAQSRIGQTQTQGAVGVKIDFLGENAQPQTLYYFATDLSDGAIENSGFLKFCERWRSGDSLLKSASYLLHSNNFSRVRDFLLARSTTIVQDDSGIPLKDFDSNAWDLRPFGTYVRPIPMFWRNYQRDLVNFFADRQAQPIEFSIGYRWKHGGSSLLLATRKPGPLEQASSGAQPVAVAPAKGQ